MNGMKRKKRNGEEFKVRRKYKEELEGNEEKRKSEGEQKGEEYGRSRRDVRRRK